MADFAASLRAAERVLTEADPLLAGLVQSVGPCTLRTEPAGFASLARAVIAQMISTAAARTITARVETLCGEAGLTPAALLAVKEDDLRAAGLSGTKARSLRGLAGEVLAGRLDLDALAAADDATVYRTLTALLGIGPWTAEMYMIFCLGRLDVLPVGDLGLRAGVQELYKLEAMPDKKALLARAEPWRPYRTVATWYFWRSRGPVPQSS